MDNLVIGGSSQLARFFPEDYTRVSSRKIDFEWLGRQRFGGAYLCFGEQRTYLNEGLDFYCDVNLHYTMRIVDAVLDSCDKVVVYATADLWNNRSGCVSASDPYDYEPSNYLKSKEMLCGRLRGGGAYEKVVIVYPFNFNSVFRREGFLFGKIYGSIMNGSRITIGDVDFRRDMVHPKVVAEESIRADRDTVVGSGELYSVGQFMRDLFRGCGKEFDEYVTVDGRLGFRSQNNEYYCCRRFSDYGELLRLSLGDISSDRRSVRQ